MSDMSRWRHLLSVDGATSAEHGTKSSYILRRLYCGSKANKPTSLCRYFLSIADSCDVSSDHFWISRNVRCQATNDKMFKLLTLSGADPGGGHPDIRSKDAKFHYHTTGMTVFFITAGILFFGYWYITRGCR